jgi:hypothetical protein
MNPLVQVSGVTKRYDSTDLSPSSIAVEDRAPDRMVSTVLPRAEKTAAVAKLRYLERELFDDGGHVRRGVTPARAEGIVVLINDLRRALGWLEIDLDGRWRWRASAGAVGQNEPRPRPVGRDPSAMLPTNFT